MVATALGLADSELARTVLNVCGQCFAQVFGTFHGLAQCLMDCATQQVSCQTKFLQGRLFAPAQCCPKFK